MPNNAIIPIGNLIGSISTGGLVPGLPIWTGEASGSIANFPDGSNNPIISLDVSVNPVQAAGTPTPETPLPISGWTGANVTRCGKNLFNVESLIANKGLDPNTGEEIAQNSTKISGWIRVDSRKTYFWNGNATRVYEYAIDKSFIQRANLVTNTSFTVSTNCAFIRFQGANNSWNISELQLEVGTSATSYESYNGTTYIITWDNEIMGGDVNVTNGVIQPYKYYSSYNGETLVGEWLSSMDVYAEGTTPTIGAQVVDFGAYDTYITIQPTPITSLHGTNNIWSDTGDIEQVIYMRDWNIALNMLWHAVYG